MLTWWCPSNLIKFRECFASKNASGYEEFGEYPISSSVEGNRKREREDRKCAGKPIWIFRRIGFYGRGIPPSAYVEGVNQMVKFMVVDCPSAYNAILGRSWIHAMEASPFIYHQVI